MSFLNGSTVKVLTNDGLILKDLNTDASNASSGSGTLYIKNDNLYFKYENGSGNNISTSTSTFRGFSDVLMNTVNFDSSLLIQTNSNGSAPSTGTLGAATNNIGIGNNVFSSLTLGKDNIALGDRALTSLSESKKNIAIGSLAGTAITTGDGKNILIGKNAGNSILTGEDNVIIGDSAGTTITTGSKNVIVGSSSDSSANNIVNEIVIGQGTTGKGSNTAVIGNNNLARLYNDVDGASGSIVYASSVDTSSDRRIKHNIKNISIGLNLITKLNPVSYNIKNPIEYENSLKHKLSWYINEEEPPKLTKEDKDKIRFGLIAQEVQDELNNYSINNNICCIDKNTSFHSLDYAKLVPILVKSIQELSLKIKNNNNLIKKLENKYIN